MKQSSIITVLGVVALLAAFVAGGRIAVSQAVTPAARVAFVDVAEIFQKYKKSNDIQQQTQAAIRQVEADLKKQFDELKKVRGDLDLLVPGTPEYTAKNREVDFGAFKLEYAEKEAKQAILAAAVRKMNLVYVEVRNEAENHARRNGLHAVFMYNAQQIEARSLEELQILIASRPVLYRDSMMDITQAVLDALQKE